MLGPSFGNPRIYGRILRETPKGHTNFDNHTYPYHNILGQAFQVYGEGFGHFWVYRVQGLGFREFRV